MRVNHIFQNPGEGLYGRLSPLVTCRAAAGVHAEVLIGSVTRHNLFAPLNEALQSMFVGSKWLAGVHLCVQLGGALDACHHNLLPRATLCTDNLRDWESRVRQFRELLPQPASLLCLFPCLFWSRS